MLAKGSFRHRALVSGVIFTLGLVSCWGSAAGSNLTLTTGGRVSIEFIFSEAAFSNTLSIVSPAVAIAVSGCKTEPVIGLPGVHIGSEKLSQRGCRVELDANPVAPDIQPFAAGTTFEFRMCAQIDADPDCEFVWSSNPSLNSDGSDHVHITPLFNTEFPGHIFQLAWEDTPSGGDQDFNDLIVIFRVHLDSDGDGLWDDWELFGIDIDGDGIIDLDLPNLLPVDLNGDGDTDDPGERVSPYHKDIFLEIDYMDCAVPGGDCAPGDTHSHRPKEAALRAVIHAFRDAPVSNPDGTTGITLRIDVSNAIAHQTMLNIPGLCFGPGPGIGDFDAVKADPANFGTANPRRFVLHYALFTHRQEATTSSGCAELPGNDFQVSLGDWNTRCISPGPNQTLDTIPSGDDLILDGRIFTGPNLVCNTSATGDDIQDVPVGSSPPADLDGDGLDDRLVGTVMQQAGTLMHELGHNLNLLHGGDEDVNRKPNYISVMNYSFQTRGIPPTDPDGAGPLTARLDFSIEDLPDLNENNLSEPAGVGNGSDFTRYVCPSGGTATGPANGAVNWNCDSDSLDTGLAVDINGDGILGILTGFNDWAHLRFNLQSTGDFEDGEHDFSKGSIELDFVTASPPIADAGAVPDGNPTTPPGPPFEAYSCNPGETLQLDGAGSFDLNGAITSYEWDFPGGGSVDATGITPSFTCPSIVGPLTVTLTVTDSDGIKATDEATIKVGPESCYDITINGVTLVGTEGNDLLIGTPRNDLLIGLGGNDALDGRGGDDILFGGEGDDQLFGNYGHDCLEGGPGFDVQAGGYGNDTFVINAGDAPTEPRATEFLQGGPGFDRVVFGTGIRPADCLGIICTDPVTGGTFTLVSIESQLDLATARLLPLNLHVIQLSANPVRRFPLAFWVAGAGVTSLRVELFSLAGLRVWQGKSRTGRLDFHGADSNGRPLANGVYLYLATITDARGKLLRPEVRKLIIKR